MTAREILSLALAKLRLFLMKRKLAGLERDQEICRRQQCEWRRAELYVQREAMLLRCDLNK